MLFRPRQNDDDSGNRKPDSILNNPHAVAAMVALDNGFISALRENPPDIGKARRALEMGANPDRIVHNGYPALHVAAMQGNAPLVELLLQYNVSVDDVNGRGATALDEAYVLKHKDVIALLKDAGAGTAMTGDHDSVTGEENYQWRIDRALGLLLRRGTVAEVQAALLLGANPNATDPNTSYEHSLFHIAVYMCNFDKVQKMLAAGASVHGKSPTGETAIDMLWWAEKENMMSPQWFAIFDDLAARGCTNLFQKHPRDMTPNDLRMIASVAHCPNTTLMHHLVDRGQAAFVIEVLKKHPEEALTAADLMRQCDKKRYSYSSETLLEAFARAEKLDEIFTAEIWQGRLEEMLTLKREVERWPLMQRQVDFNRAAEDIRARRVSDLKSRAKRIQPADKPKEPRP